MFAEIIIYAVAFGLAVLLGLAGTAAARATAVRLGVFDRPDKRKVHQAPVPYLGGVGMYVAFLAYGTLVRQIAPHFLHDYVPAPWFPAGALAGALLVAVGVWDDVRGISAWVKFPVQIVAILILTLLGDLEIASVAHPFGGYIEFGRFSIAVTVLWGVFLINAINLIDGLDGLAAGVVAISCGFIFANDLIQAQPRFLALGLAGVCLGFLRYNFSPARIFMGDAGSMFLGLLLAAFSMQIGVKGTTVVTLLFPIIVLGIPLLDTAFAFLRRLSQGKHPFQGDARHIHHRFLAMGLSDRQVVMVIYFFCIAFGLFALVIGHLTPAYRLAALVLLVLLVSFVIMALKYLETQLQKAMEEVNAYKEWIEYRRQGESHGVEDEHPPDEDSVPDLAELLAAEDRRRYSPPAVNRTAFERLIRAEEQRTEEVLVVASPEWGERLGAMIARAGHHVESVAEAGRGEVVLREGRIGVLVVEDLQAIGRLDEFVVTAKLTNPKITVLVLTASGENQAALGLLRLGVSALLPGCAPDEVLEAIIHNALESRYLARRLDFINILFWILIFSIPFWIVVGRYIAIGF